MMQKLIWMMALIILGSACGDDADPRDIGQVDPTNNEFENNLNNANNTQPSLALACDDTESAVGLEGSVFTDDDDLANSSYALPEQARRSAMAGVEVRLQDNAGHEWSTETCDDGSFRFGALDSERQYFVDAVLEGRVTSVNDSTRTYDAIRDDEPLDLVVFGDSIPSFGGTPWFPNVMRDSLTSYDEVELSNVAVPGSRSFEWLPGEPYFDADLAPLLEDADVIVFSLGGNDLQEFAFELQSSADPISQVGELQPLIDEIKRNLSTILAEIREKAPTADVVWILYPNYATSTEWAALLGEYADAGERIVGNLLEDVREALAEEPDLIMVDMLAATEDVSLDLYLADPLHLNTDGHAFYAEEILQTLGFVTDPESPRRYDFAVAP